MDTSRMGNFKMANGATISARRGNYAQISIENVSN